MCPQIEISPDLYVALRTLMEPDDRTPSDVIWRLVQDQQVRRTDPPARETGWRIDPSEGVPSGGAVIPNGIRLRGRHGTRKVIYADVKRGKILVDGEAFESPSKAAIYARRLLGSPAQSINGWMWWDFESPKGSENWRPLDTLRQPWQVKHRRSRFRVS
jgi:hypothetical protein